METPFDKLLDRFVQSIFYTPRQNAEFGELFIIVHSFTRIARVLYINMVNASEKLELYALSKHYSLRNFTQAKLRERDDILIQCKLSFFQFIDHVNRTGRVLEKKGFSLPFYARVYFFRNKMVEHWDDYLRFILDGDGLISYKDKIAIPYAFSGNILNDAGRASLQQQITLEFDKSRVVLPPLEDKWYGEYADLIYAGLEQIDSRLRKYNGKIGIPEPLVTLLFKYSFPTPISNMEEYCKTLATWLEDLPLTSF